jgi:hypothetical protein
MNINNISLLFRRNITMPFMTWLCEDLVPVMAMLLGVCHFLMFSPVQIWFMEGANVLITPRDLIVSNAKISTMTYHGNQLLANNQMHVKVSRYSYQLFCVVLSGAYKQQFLSLTH